MQGGGQVSQGKRPTTRKCMHVNSSSRHVVPGGRLGTDISNGRSYDGGPSRGALCSRPATLPIAAFPGVPGCSRLPWHNPRPRRWQSRGAEHVDVVGAASAPAESTQDPAAGAHDQQALIVHLTIRWCIHRINVAGQRHACQAAGDWYGGWITLPCNSGPPLWL